MSQRSVRQEPQWQGLARSLITYIERKSRLENKIIQVTPHLDEDDEQQGTVEDEVTEFHSIASSDEEKLWKKKAI